MAVLASTVAGINAQPHSPRDHEENWRRLATYTVGDGITLDADGRLKLSLELNGGLEFNDDGELTIDKAALLEPGGNLDIGDSGGIQVAYNIVTGEAPTGSINGINKIFVLAHNPITNSLAVYKSQLRLQGGVGYSLNGNIITFALPPATQSVIMCDYRWNAAALQTFTLAAGQLYPLAEDLASTPIEGKSLAIGSGVMQWLDVATTDDSVEIWS